MNAGDTLVIALPNASVDSHLWMVTSEPSVDGKCVIVNFTSWREDKDQACVVDVGEHPYIRHKTCVDFKDAKCLDTADLDALISSGQCIRHRPLSPELLQKVRDGAYDSRMELGMVDILVDHGVIDE